MKRFYELREIATPVCALARNDLKSQEDFLCLKKR